MKLKISRQHDDRVVRKLARSYSRRTNSRSHLPPPPLPLSLPLSQCIIDKAYPYHKQCPICMRLSAHPATVSRKRKCRKGKRTKRKDVTDCTQSKTKEAKAAKTVSIENSRKPGIREWGPSFPLACSNFACSNIQPEAPWAMRFPIATRVGAGIAFCWPRMNPIPEP